MFCNIATFYDDELLAPRPTSKLEDHPLLSVHNCLLNIFMNTLHIGGLSSICNLRKLHAVVTETHLSCIHGNLPIQIYEEKNKIISQIYHAVSHMFLQLTPIMNLSGIKHSRVSSGHCKIPARSQHIRRLIRGVAEK